MKQCQQYRRSRQLPSTEGKTDMQSELKHRYFPKILLDGYRLRKSGYTADYTKGDSYVIIVPYLCQMIFAAIL